MSAGDEYHRSLHEQIFAAQNLADWIYHDVRLDCDGGARLRLAERIQLINEEHGKGALYAVAASWAQGCLIRINSALRRLKAQGLENDSVTSSANPMPILPDNASSNLDIFQRAQPSASQFISAISNDDLEMAEAIFNAAWEASEEDAGTLITVLLQTCIHYSDIAKSVGYAK